MKTLTVLVSTILLGSTALAQEGGMPDMSPPKELAPLHALVGTWKGKEKHFEPGTTDAVETESTVTYTLVLGGHFIRGDYKSSFPGMGEFSGMMMMSYDPEAKKQVMTWFDSMSNSGMKATATVTGKKFAYLSEEFDMPGMGKMKMRTTFDLVSATSYTMMLEMQMGDAWMKVLDGTYTKQ